MRADEEAAPTFPREIPYLAILTATVAWGVGPLLVRGISSSPVTISFYRLWLAVPVTMLVAKLAGSRLTMRVVRLSVVPGVLFGLSILVGFASFQRTSLANATLITALQPVLVVLVAGRLFGEQVGRRELLLGCGSLVGIALVVLGAGGTSGASLGGDLLAVANLVLFTAYFLVVKRHRTDGVSAAALLAGVILCAALTVTPFALLEAGDLGTISGRDWLFLALMVLIPGTLGHGLMNWAQRYVDVTISSLLILLNPVVSTVGAWLVYSQALNTVQIVGAVVVLASLAAIVAAQRRPGEIVAEPLE